MKSGALLPKGDQPRVLVVDDNPDICALHTAVLQRGGFQVDVACDGEEAWAAMKANSYAVLITDNQMPKMSGLDLVEKLRTALSTVPVILAASPLSAEDRGRCTELQLSATLWKPYAPVELLEAVRKAASEVSAPSGVDRVGAESA